MAHGRPSSTTTTRHDATKRTYSLPSLSLVFLSTLPPISARRLTAAMVSHQSPLIWIPPKQTEEVDISTAVRSLISTSYGEDPKRYSSALSALARARTDATTSATSSGSDTTARDLLFKWFHILEMLEVRFPELRVPFTWKDAFTARPISQFSLAYEKASVIFNIAAVLSAVASSESRLSSAGSTADVTSPRAAAATLAAATSPSSVTADSSASAATADGTKRAYTALRQAAGFFNYINQNFLHAPSTDMSRDLLRFIVSLLLTQANEVFLEKQLASGKSSPGLTAKLAHGVAKGYTDLAERAKEWNNQEIIDRTWTMLVNAKAKHYTSVMQYYKAQADIAASNHGHALVRFTVAETLSKEAVKFANQFSANFASSGPSASAATTLGYTTQANSAFTFPVDAGVAIVGLTSAHLALVSQRRAEAVKDNDLIYHDILPSESTLPLVDETAPAQLITIQEVYASPEVQRVVGPDLFAKLVPLGVHERASMYSEEKAKLARAEAERSDSAEGERVAALDGMGLPAGLEKFRAAVRTSHANGGGSGLDALADPGPQVMAWSEEEVKGGPARGADGISSGSEGVNSTLSRIGQLRQTAQSDLANASDLLDDESRACEKARVRLGAAFGQDPSGGQPRVKDLRSEIKTNREALRQAQENDARIEAKWREISADVDLLARGRGALEQAFAEALASGGGGSQQTSSMSLLDLSEQDEAASAESLAGIASRVEAIDSALSKLTKVKKERDSLLAELREKLQSDDIGHLLILSHRGGSKSSSSSGDNNGSSAAGNGGGDESDTAIASNNSQAAHEAALFRRELEKFRPWQQRLGQAHAAQSHLLAEINKTWTELNATQDGQRISAQWNAKSAARTALVERLRRARDANAEVRAALAKGLGFYEEAGEIARGLKVSARDWNETRKREREGMERQAEWDGKLQHDSGSNADTGLERAMSGMGFGGGGGDSAAATTAYGSHPAPPPPPLHAPPQRQSSYGAVSASYGSPAPTSPYGHAPAPPRSYASPPPPAPPSSGPSSTSIGGFGIGGNYGTAPVPPSTSSSSGGGLPPPPPPRGPYSSFGSTPTPSSYGGGGGATPSGPPSLPQQQPPQQYQRQTSAGSYGLPPPPPPPSTGNHYGYHQPQSQSPAQPPPPPPPQQQQYNYQYSQPPSTPHYHQQQYSQQPPPPPPLPPQEHQHQPSSGGGQYYQPSQQPYSSQPPPPPPPGQWRGY